MVLFNGKLFQRVSLLSIAFILAISSMSAAVPLFLTHVAHAVPNTVYTSTSFEDLSLAPDRQVPSTYSTTPTTLTENIDNTRANTSSTFYQTEGLKGVITSSKSIEAQLYIDSTWSGKKVQAGLWGVTSSATETGNAWPIIQYSSVSDGGFVGFRVFDTMNGGWTNLDGIAATPGQTYTLEIAYNSSTENYDFYVNGSLALSKTAMDGTNVFNSFTGVIFDNYNFATGNSADNYSIKWSNFSRGTSPTVADTNIAYVNASTGSDSNDGVTAATAFKTIQHGVDAVTTGGTVHVADGSYTEKISLTKGGVTIDGQSTAGTIVHPLINAYGQGFTSEGFGDVTINNLSIQVTNKVTNGGYALKFHNAQNISLNNVAVSAASGNSMGGIDFSAVNGIQLSNVSSNGFSKNGIAFTSKYANTDAYQTGTVGLSNISSTNNGWAGIAFYNVSGGGAALDMNSVTFNGTNTVTGNGQMGVFFEGGTDAQFGSGGAPTYAVTGASGANVDLGNTTFSANALNIVNFQTNDVTANGAVINGKLGNDMSAAELQTAGLSIIDQADNSTYGKVILDSAAPTVPTNLSWIGTNNHLAVNGFTNVQTGTLSWQDTSTDVNHYIYKFWTNIAGYYNGESNAWTTDSSQYITTNPTGGSIWTDFANKEGTYSFCVEAVDAVGNASACSATYSVTYDSTAPTGIATYNGGNKVGDVIYLKTINDLKYTLNLSDNYNLEHTSYAVWKADSSFGNRTLFCGNWNGAITSVPVSGVSATLTGNVKACSPTSDWSNGNYVIMHVVYDAAGNLTYFGGTYPGQKFTVDNTAPVLYVKSGDKLVLPSSLASSTFNNVSFKLYDNKLVDRAEINGIVKDVSNSQWSDVNGVTAGVFGAKEGANTIVLYDVAGNTTSYTFTIDTTAPVGTLTYSPSTLTNSGVTVTLTTDEAIQQSALPGTWNKVSDTVYKKAYSVNATQSVTLKDLVGNTSTVNVAINWIDKTAPVVAVDSANTTINTPIITGTVTDPAADVTLRINGTPFAAINNSNGTWSYTVLSPLANNTYNLEVTAKDAAGNVSPVAIGTLVVATTAPITTNTTVTPAGATTTPATVDTTVAPTGIAANTQTVTDNLGTPEVLGTQTKADATDTAATPEVKGASTQADQASGWALAWYWWVLIIAAVASFIWWLIARRRNLSEA